jgi:hypothetical protein
MTPADFCKHVLAARCLPAAALRQLADAAEKYAPRQRERIVQLLLAAERRMADAIVAADKQILALFPSTRR